MATLLQRLYSTELEVAHYHISHTVIYTFYQKIVYKIWLHLMVQRCFSMTATPTEIPTFAAGLLHYFPWEGEKQSFTFPCTCFLVACIFV